MRKSIINGMLSLMVAFTLTGLLSACSGGDKATKQSVEEQTYLARVALTAEQFNQTLPKDEGILELTKYTFDPKQKLLTLTHRFTTDEIAEPTPELIQNVRNTMVAVMGHNADEMDYIQHGITFKFDYYTINGDFLFSTSISPDDFNGINALKPN